MLILRKKTVWLSCAAKHLLITNQQITIGEIIMNKIAVLMKSWSTYLILLYN